MIIGQTKTALGPKLTASFLASGGTPPYAYSVAPGGAGGSIDAGTGIYTAPALVSDDPLKFYDTIIATDSAPTPLTIHTKIEVGNSWMLMLEIIKRILKLDPQMIWFQNQKQFQPENASKGMWVVLMFPSINTFASGIHPAGSGDGWDQTEKWANFSGPVDIHLFSRDLSALNRKEEVVMALTGPYSRQQQISNSFYLARIPHNIVDISGVDGAAIPYHFVISVELQYAKSRLIASDYYDEVPTPELIFNQ